MSLLNILYGVDSAEIGALTLDASLREEHSVAVEVTKHPVEQGSDISDHKRKGPDKVRITGIISNTPLRLFNFGPSELKPAENAWEVLNEMAASKELVTIITTLKTYEDMAMTDLRAPRDFKLGNVLEFTASFERLHLVRSSRAFSSQRTQSAADKVAKKKAAQAKKADAGKQPPKKTTILDDIASSEAGKAALKILGF